MDGYRDAVAPRRGGVIAIRQIVGSGCYDITIKPNDSGERLVVDDDDLEAIALMIERVLNP